MYRRLIGAVAACAAALVIMGAASAQDSPGTVLGTLAGDMADLRTILGGLDQRERAAVASLLAIERTVGNFPVTLDPRLRDARSRPLPGAPPELTPYLDSGREFPCIAESIAYATSMARCLADAEPPEAVSNDDRNPPDRLIRREIADRGTLTFRELVIMVLATQPEIKPKKTRAQCERESAPETAAEVACIMRHIGGLRRAIAKASGRR